MKLTVKRYWLWFGLVLTIAATLAVGDPPQEPPLAEPIERTPRQDATVDAASPVKRKGSSRLSELKRASMETTETNPFAPKSWYVPPPPPPTQDIKPVPPPLPFTYKGKLGENDERQLFYLTKGDESFVVAVGDTFAGSYKLESARPGSLLIRYLPLSAAQTLRYGPDL